VTIEDLPLERRYSFVGEDGKELLSLSVYDLKLMGERICKHFSKPKKDVEKIIGDIGMWACN
jgi:hypothetical protein